MMIKPGFETLAMARVICSGGRVKRVAAAAGIFLLLAGCNKRNPMDASKTQTSKTDNYGLKIGIALQTTTGVCLSIVNSNLPANTLVSLVDTSTPQSIADAVVTGPGPGCPGFDDPASSNYALRIQRGRVDDDLELIAVIGGSKLSVTSDGKVVGHLDNDPQEDTFRSCTSSEGVHLTVWRGNSLSGVRLWHGYHHLDYGTEPNCTDQETAP